MSDKEFKYVCEFDTVLYLKAIRALPEEWVHKDTKLTLVAIGKAIAVNPNFAPIEFKNQTGWQPIVAENL